jgi:hypothetical protein
MEWTNVISKRRTTYRWTDQTPNKSLIDEIVQEIHNYCPSKQKKVPFFIDVIDNTDPNAAPNAVELLISNKSLIQTQATNWITQQVAQNVPPFNGFVYDASKCTRDIGFMVSAIINDVRYSTNQYTRDYVSTYWKNGAPRVRQFAEIPTWDYIKGLIINQILPTDNNIETGVAEQISTLIDNLKSVIQNGPASLPVLIPGLSRIRMKLWESVDRKGNGKIDDIRNPQVLAPWLLLFSYRNLTDREIGLNSEMKISNINREIAQNEIGMASMFTVLSAESKGLDTAFCACIRNKSEVATLLGHHNSEIPIVAVGIGHRDTTPGNTYFNKLIYDTKNIPDSNYDIRPAITKYVRYHVA